MEVKKGRLVGGGKEQSRQGKEIREEKKVRKEKVITIKRRKVGIIVGKEEVGREHCEGRGGRKGK